MQDKALFLETFAKPGKKVERPKRNRAANLHAMRCVRRNPNGPERRDDPDRLPRAKGHNSLGSKQELVFRVGMLGDDMTISKVRGNAGDLSKQATLGTAKDALALVQHFLSP